jgi:hypothetical protein
MGPMLERPTEKETSKSLSHLESNEAVAKRENVHWARGCATAGAIAWAVIAVLARMGIARFGEIELLFLFAPLVIVPLGLELSCATGGASAISYIAQRLQPVAASLAVIAMWLPVGRSAGAAALGWMALCLLIAGDGVVFLWRTLNPGLHAARNLATLLIQHPVRSLAWPARVAIAVAKIDLAVGGAWFVASRLGLRPMGIQEPIGLLTAVHFHYAGFATATIAAATLAFAESYSSSWWPGRLVLLVTLMPLLVATGFVISPLLKMTAAVVFALGTAVLAVWLRACAKKSEKRLARALLHVAAASVFAAMVLAAMYAIADFRGSDVLTIPQMAHTHGILNSVGFCLPALLGWLVENDRGGELG